MFSRFVRLASVVFVTVIAATAFVSGQSAAPQSPASARPEIAQATEQQPAPAAAIPAPATTGTEQSAKVATAPAKKSITDDAIVDSILESLKNIKSGDSVDYDVVTITIKHQRQTTTKSVDTKQLIAATDYGLIATQNIVTVKEGQVRIISIGNVAGQPILKIKTKNSGGKPQMSQIYIGAPVNTLPKN
ncbi:MAG: hypothetical protein PHE24_03795 [Patescibacteria group bacterium]|nr:hypothetical protein [Patescibacteria group bacterium]